MDITFYSGVFSIAGSLIAAYLSYIIYKYNKLSADWLAITLAFILVIFRRILGFASEFRIYPEHTELIKSFESILLLAISALYIWGLWSMKKTLDRFALVEKNVSVKIDPAGANEGGAFPKDRQEPFSEVLNKRER